jgi:hypothetical protein
MSPADPELASEVQTLNVKRVRVSPIIVSSMGAIYGPPLRSLKRIFDCTDRELRILMYTGPSNVRHRRHGINGNMARFSQGTESRP